MHEVNYIGEDLKLVEDFNKSANKKTEDWSDEKYSNLRKKIKDHYLKEQDYTCFFCRQRIKVKHNRAWDTEHIIARSLYPKFTFEPKNLCVICIDCNIEKSDDPVLRRNNIVKLPKKSGSYKLIHPHFDDYDDHIQVLVVGELYKHKSPKGKFTFRLYGLDRFYAASGLDKDEYKDTKAKNLMRSALMDTGGYEELEMKLLQELIIKRSNKIGKEEAFDIIKKLNE